MSTFQDDEREEFAIKLFKLEKDKTEGRSGIDAYLNLNGKRLPFELKSTSNGSVTTVRDFGHEHIKKWKNKHWLIGVYEKETQYFLYGSPKMMAPWILEKEQYILPDFQLAKIAKNKLDLEDLFEILGEKKTYSYEDARRLHKRQYSKEQYFKMMDIKNGYTPTVMLKILKDRAMYLMERGSTLNNPHIPKSYFTNWIRITSKHAETLRNMIDG